VGVGVRGRPEPGWTGRAKRDSDGSQRRPCQRSGISGTSAHASRTPRLQAHSQSRRKLDPAKINRNGAPERSHPPDQVDLGDAYCFTAIERESKLLLTWHLGTRTPEDAAYFADKLALATSGKFQISTDGFTPYGQAIPAAMPMADFAQIIKQFATKSDGKESKYSPGEVIGTVKVPRHGSPDMAKVCTSHIERHNLTLRMQNRRLTRLTNGFSKKWGNHSAAFALQFAFYNYVRIHETLDMTPAMKAGLEDHPWSIEELIRNSAVVLPAQK